MTNLALAGLSNTALYVAMGLLALAMIAYAAHVAIAVPRGRGTRRPRPVEGTSEAADEVPALEPATVAAGPTTAEVGDSRGPATRPAGSVRDALAGAGEFDTADDAATPARGGAAGGIGMSLSWLGTMFLALSVGLRGASVQRLPAGNMFEFAVFGALFVMIVYLVMAMRYPLRWLGLFVVTPVLLTLGLALTVWYTPASELLPSLQSMWLAIHVPVAVLAVALFTIAFSVLLLQLLKERREATAGHRHGGPLAFLDVLPASSSLDRVAYTLHIVAFPLWTFSLIAGAIWAQKAWGSYWNWDPKETWTFVIWVIYAAYLHARATSGWSRRTANLLAVLGYIAIIINFTIVNLYFQGQHSYSGL